MQHHHSGRRRFRFVGLLWIVLGLGCLNQSLAPMNMHASPPDSVEPSALAKKLATKTIGGRQFWGDVAFFHDWRIQQNTFTGHYRLLDGEDYRHASGTLKKCQAKLAEIKQEQKLPDMSGRAVILIHGIIRSAKSLSGLEKALEEAGYHVFGFNYPSTRIEIAAAAEYLHRAIESLEGIEEINLVVHSLGGLVVRAYLEEHGDKRIRRMVMAGVPNLGAHMANRFQKNVLYRAILGPAGQQLVKDPDGYIAKLPTPDFEFAILAGGRSNDSGYNPLIPGDDDGTVTVASTRLPGAADFAIVNSLHSFLINNEQAIDYTVRFLQTGKLRETDPAQPIPKPDDAEEPSESATK